MAPYTIVPCPICGDASYLTLLKATNRDLVFFYCNACGCAWDKPPEPLTVDSVDPIEKYAPEGSSEATVEEIQAAGFKKLIK